MTKPLQPYCKLKKCNVTLNYDKLQYKQNEVEFLVRPIQQVATNQA